MASTTYTLGITYQLNGSNKSKTFSDMKEAVDAATPAGNIKTAFEGLFDSGTYKAKTHYTTRKHDWSAE